MATATTTSTELQRKLCEMPENDFSSQVLVPFLSSMGYGKVEFFGGTDEEGKDVIGWKRDETGRRPWLGVMQVKKFKLSRRAADTRSFSEVINQLCMCVEKALPNADGGSYLPNVVYLVTPYNIDTKVLGSRIERVAQLKGRISILEGIELCELLIEKIPDVIDRLFGLHLDITRALARTLNNRQLLSALRVDSDRHVSTFYIDLNLQIGGSVNSDFFLVKPRGAERVYELTASEWQHFVECNRMCNSLRTSIIVSSEEAVIQERERRQVALAEWTTAESLARSRMQAVRVSIAEAERNLAEKLEFLRDERHRAIQQELNALPLPPSGETDPNKEKRLQLSQQIQALEAPAKPLEQRRQDLREQLGAMQTEHDRIMEARPLETYRVEATGKPLAKAIIAERRMLTKQIDQYNVTTPSPDELRTFVQRCSQLSLRLRDLLGYRFTRELLGLAKEPCEVPNQQVDGRLCVPLDRMIDTGANLWVFGDAGAGKTTSLQYYAWRCLSDDDGRLGVYVPLSRLARMPAMARYPDTSNATTAISTGVTEYLNDLGVQIDRESLVSQMRTRRGVLLLDGIDEAVARCPAIVSAIAEYVRESTDVQVVTSSRIGGAFRDIRQFLGVTLLPFTDDQRDRFVKDWFNGSRPEIAEKVVRHCRHTPLLAEVVRTPLSTTILCVLADRELPLPSTEAHLYRSRFELLFTEYDLHKGISRVQSERVNLELVARKVAYWLHEGGRREATMEELLRACRDSVNLPHRLVSRAVQELADPCNVLVPMTEDGSLGFGHLRFQEFLVALELLSNRGLDGTSKLRKTWWHGALHLMAEMSESLKWLVDTVVMENRASVSHEILAEMFNVGPASERARNLQMLARYRDQPEYPDSLPLDNEDWE